MGCLTLEMRVEVYIWDACLQIEDVSFSSKKVAIEESFLCLVCPLLFCEYRVLSEFGRKLLKCCLRGYSSGKFDIVCDEI